MKETIINKIVNLQMNQTRFFFIEDLILKIQTLMHMNIDLKK